MQTVADKDAKGAEAPVPLRQRVRPSHIVIGIGVAVALFTAASGIVAAFTNFKSDSSVTRAVFRNIPDSLKAVFYTVIPLVLVVVAVLFANRVKNWQRGAPDSRKVNRRNFKARLHDLRAGLSMQTLLRDPAAGIMHSMIYFSFLVLVGVTTALEIDHQLPPSAKFLEGTVYQIYSAVGDIAGAVLIAGVVWAGLRRWGPRQVRPYRTRIKTKPEHAVILGTLFAVSVTGFLTEGFRIAEDGTPDFETLVGVRLLDSPRGGRLGQHSRMASVLVDRSCADFRDVSADSAGNDAASHLHLAGEHVAEAERPPERRHAADAQPHGERFGDLRRGHH